MHFEDLDEPIIGIDTILLYIYFESLERGYNFDRSKFINIDLDLRIDVNSGQVDYEWEHLLKKLEVRDIERFNRIKDDVYVETNPLFTMIAGEIEDWERV